MFEACTRWTSSTPPWASLCSPTSSPFTPCPFSRPQAALTQLDREYEAVSDSLAAPFTRLLRTVTLPVCLPAVIEICYDCFVRSMTTLSAVIFLYSADIPLAAVAVANMDDAGDTAAALAKCLLVVAITLVAPMVYGLCAVGVRRRARVRMQRRW